MFVGMKKIIHFAKSLIGPFVALLFLTYVVYHLINGNRGMKSYLSLQQEIKEKNQMIAHLAIQKEELEKQVKSLGTKSLDIDLLEERIRIMLGLGGHKEVTVIYSEEDD